MSKEQADDNIAWFTSQRFGLFVHWGLYSILGRGEWVQKRDGIPVDEYAKLTNQWNPCSFAPESWCLAAKKAGMRYVVFTALHHDGFALFDSKADAFNSMNTPARFDFVKAFVDACHKHGLGVGIYYSLVDWRFVENGRCTEEQGVAMRTLAHAQIEELMTRYGKIDILWYDGLCCPTKENPVLVDKAAFWEAEKLNAMVRSHQPSIVINNRSGIDEDFGTIEGRNIIRPLEGVKAWEACMTLGDDDFSYWGYCHSAFNRRTPAQVLLLLLHTLEFGGNFLLNVGPGPDGIIPAWQAEILDVVGSWVHENHEAVFGTEATNVARPTPKSHQGNSCGFFTAKGSVLYFYLYEWPGHETRIPCLRTEISSVTVLKTGQILPFRREADGAFVVSGLPDTSLDPLCTVLKFTCGHGV